MIGVVVNFHQQAVGSGGDGGASHRQHHLAASGAVGWIGDDGQMGELLYHRNSGDIHGVARVGFECANTAFAEDDFVVSAGHDVLGGQQEFFNSCGDPPLQKHGHAQLPHLL